MSEQAERRTLKMHPRLLWDVIHRQAGSLGKAILEGVMNSVDAGATHCDVTIGRESFSISDDGKGFASDEEINKFFETFGFPHEDGDAKYGRFRMGRGQMMAFGRNTWVTNVYRMDVDLKPQKNEMGEDYALGYEFRKVKENAKGCSVSVELYDKLSPSGLDSVIREIGDYVKYVSIPVKLNGKIVSCDPAEQEWDEETGDAYIKRKASGTLDIYNQGVLVCKASSYRHGASGIVVSKEALDVNFARNDVQSTCPRFKRIVRMLQEDNMEQVKRNAPLTDTQRDFFARELASGESSLEELKDARIVTDITGSHHPFSVLQRLGHFQDTLSVAERGDRVAEMAHTRRMGFFVTDECANRFGATNEKELLKVFNDIMKANGYGLLTLRAVARPDYDRLISSSHEPVADKELNKAERLALKAIREGADTIHTYGTWRDRTMGTDVFLKGKDHGKRRISVGSSDTAAAWTDGVKDIWIERGQLKSLKEGYPGMYRLANLVLHEYLHNGPSTGTHEHGVEFYNRFHDIGVYTTILSDAANAMMRLTLKELRQQNQHIAQQMVKFEDNVAEADDRGLGSYTKTLGEDADLDPFVPEIEESLPEPSQPEPAQPLPVAALGSEETAAVRRQRRKPEADDRQISMGF